MSEGRSYIDLAVASIKVFVDDGKLDLQELEGLLALAFADGKIDEDEKRVLGNIFKQAEKAGASSSVALRIRELRRKYDLP